MLVCRSALFCLALSAAPGLAAVQATPASPAVAPQAATAPSFLAEPYVLENVSTLVTMHADGTGTRLQSFRIRIQSESALRSFSIVSIAYPRSAETADFAYARVRHPDGSVQETPTTEAVDQPAPVTREAPGYSDLQIKQLPIKYLRVGDTLEWQARTTITHPEIPNQFWGQSFLTEGAVLLSETFELRTPLAVHPTIWTNPRASATFTETTEGTERVDRWSHADLHPTVGSVAEAAKQTEERRQLTPEEQLDLTEGKLPSFAWTTFSDWAAVGAWYRSLSADRAVPDSTVRAKVAELTAGKSTELEKAQALYAYVSSEIHYIGVSFGIGRYQPHAAAEVLANQYGDCKDKHTLLAAMFAAAGLHADPVLIGAGIRFNPAVPSPAAFNHLITRLFLDGHDLLLDSTTELAPWRALVPAIRDHQALWFRAPHRPSSCEPLLTFRTPRTLWRTSLVRSIAPSPPSPPCRSPSMTTARSPFALFSAPSPPPTMAPSRKAS